MSSARVSFAVLAALVTITPGIDTVMVLRATLAGGRRVGAATAADLEEQLDGLGAGERVEPGGAG